MLKERDHEARTTPQIKDSTGGAHILGVEIQEACKQASQSDEPTIHKSALVVDREPPGRASNKLEESHCKPTAPEFLKKCPAGKDCRPNGVDNSGYYFDSEEIDVLSGGVGSSLVSPHFQRMNGEYCIWFICRTSSF